MSAPAGRIDEALPTGAARWPLATRPGFLTITAVAGLLGIAAAFADGMAIEPAVAALALLGALLAHASANVINDVHDAANGSDDTNTDRIFPFTGGSRFIQQGIINSTAMRRLALLLFAATALSGLGLMLLSTPWLMAFGVTGLGLAWAYSAPPLQLMARGLGEVAVAAGWLLVVAGMDFALRRQLAPTAWWAGGGLALLVANILFA